MIRIAPTMTAREWKDLAQALVRAAERNESHAERAGTLTAMIQAKENARQLRRRAEVIRSRISGMSPEQVATI